MEQSNVEQSWKRIEAWLGKKAPKVLKTLQLGASDAQIAELEQTIGAALPDDFKASYRVHNGQLIEREDDFGLFDASEFLSLERIAEEWDIWNTMHENGEFNEIHGEPAGAVKKDWWHPKWIPFTYDGEGNHLCLDLDPAEGGTVGQVITMWHDEPSRRVVSNSFAQWLQSFAEDFEAGEYVLSSDYSGVIRRTIL